jgi:osmoprotectant transport system permease protein
VLVVLAALAPGFGAVHGTYVVGTKSFTEQYVLGALMQQRLTANGLSSERRDGLG